MKRRLNLAAALLHDPELLLLDEPTVGVDPQSRNAIFDNIAALRRRGKTILYTTHYMEEVERLCDRVVILDHGRVIADDSLAGLRQRAGRQRRVRVELAGAANLTPRGLEELRRQPGVLTAEATEPGLDLAVTDMALALPPVFAVLGRCGVTVVAVDSDRPSLERVFLELTGRTLRDG
jgi:ABC-2 type transport system ATP-binding protein